MKKKSDKPVEVTAETVAAAIKTADDFGFELRVRAALETAGGRVKHGWTYIDPTLGKRRQFDIRALLCHPERGQFLQLSIECKNLSPGVPMVVSGTGRTKEESFHDVVVADRTLGLRQSVRRTTVRDEVYPVGDFVGKSIFRLKPSNDKTKLISDRDSEIYDTWTQALASADELCKDAAFAGDGGPSRPNYTFVIPMVVVPNGSIWMVHYKSDGTANEEPSQVDEVTVFVKHRVEVVKRNNWMDLSHVHFLTFAGLTKFLTKLHPSGNSWERWFPANSEDYRPPIPRE